MAKKTCTTCIYNHLDTGLDKVIRHHCFLNPPQAMPMQTQGGLSWINAARPVIRPEIDFCREHLEDPIIKPH